MPGICISGSNERWTYARTSGPNFTFGGADGDEDGTEGRERVGRAGTTWYAGAVAMVGVVTKDGETARWQ